MGDFDLNDELQQLLDRAVEEGMSNDDILGELEMAAQQMRDAMEYD
jgi:hypothetical protein